MQYRLPKFSLPDHLLFFNKHRGTRFPALRRSAVENTWPACAAVEKRGKFYHYRLLPPAPKESDLGGPSLFSKGQSL
jgi:hypothetical protein